MKFVPVIFHRLSALSLAAAILWMGTVQAADHSSIPIYRCTQNGTTVYSDIACAGLADAAKIDVRVANGYTPAATPVERKAAVRSSKVAVRDNSANLAEAQRKQCQSMKRSLDQIHSKMRSGYRVREGERLRDRESQLDERLRQERCH
jgi:hypothetical protein